LKRVLVVALIVSFCCSSFAQQEEKIKGNKDVVEKRMTIPNTYHTLDIDGEFEVYLRKQSSLSATIETDSNLLAYVDIAVNNGVLSITTTKKIVRAKLLKIELGYDDSLTTVILKDKVTVLGDQAIKGEKLLIEAKDNVEVKLDIATLSAEVLLKNKAKFEGQLTSKEVSIDQSGTSKTEASIPQATSVNITLHEKSSSELNGATDKTVLLLDGDSYLNAIKFNSGIISLSSTDDADTYIKCVDKAVLQLSGKSDTYIMGNPLVQLTRFEDESSLHKTKKEPSSLGRLLK